MRSLPFRSRLVGLTAILQLFSSCICQLERGPYPKDNDILQCNNFYGTGLDPQKCAQALESMPDGIQFSMFVSQKRYPGQTASEVPVYYFDKEGKTHMMQSSIDVPLKCFNTL